MADQIQLEIATPERQLVSEKVNEITVPAKNGYMGILPGHAPLVGMLGTGSLSYLCGGTRRSLAIQGGFIEVLPEQVRILANLAERAEDIDLDRARSGLEQARKRLETPAEDSQAALDAVALAEARVSAAEKKQR
jgi:F-type H+-transporting ATPase subunit epsilon